MKKTPEEIQEEKELHPNWYNGTYMSPEHPLAFMGYIIAEPQSYMKPDTYRLCPRCKGHGGWILTYDAYGEGRPFRQLCSVCNGQGWQALKYLCTSEDGIHNFVFDEKLGNCYNQYKCTICDATKKIDSSD